MLAFWAQVHVCPDVTEAGAVSPEGPKWQLCGLHAPLYGLFFTCDPVSAHCKPPPQPLEWNSHFLWFSFYFYRYIFVCMCRVLVAAHRLFSCNMQPGPLFEGNPVGEGTTRRGTATPVHRPQRPAKIAVTYRSHSRGPPKFPAPLHLSPFSPSDRER